MAFLCGFQNFMVATNQQYFCRFVANKSSFTLEKQHSKHVHGPNIYKHINTCINTYVRNYSCLFFFPYSFYNRQIKARSNFVFDFILCTRTTTKALLDRLKLLFWRKGFTKILNETILFSFRLGYAIAQRLGEEGAKVLISSSKERNVNEAVKNLKELDIEASGTVCDVSKREDNINLVKTVMCTSLAFSWFWNVGTYNCV